MANRLTRRLWPIAPTVAVNRFSETWVGDASSGQGPNELVRYKFTIGGTSGTWILFRMPDPIWFDAVKA